jgi:hypothetical protein
MPVAWWVPVLGLGWSPPRRHGTGIATRRLGSRLASFVG